MAAIYSNGSNRWNILGFNFTKRDALSSVYKISMIPSCKLQLRWLNLIIVFRDMVWKLSKLQSGYNELCVYVEPYLTPCTSFVLGLLIFK